MIKIGDKQVQKIMMGDKEVLKVIMGDGTSTGSLIYQNEVDTWSYQNNASISVTASSSTTNSWTTITGDNSNSLLFILFPIPTSTSNGTYYNIQVSTDNGSSWNNVAGQSLYIYDYKNKILYTIDNNGELVSYINYTFTNIRYRRGSSASYANTLNNNYGPIRTYLITYTGDTPNLTLESIYGRTSTGTSNNRYSYFGDLFAKGKAVIALGQWSSASRLNVTPSVGINNQQVENDIIIYKPVSYQKEISNYPIIDEFTFQRISDGGGYNTSTDQLVHTFFENYNLSTEPKSMVNTIFSGEAYSLEPGYSETTKYAVLDQSVTTLNTTYVNTDYSPKIYLFSIS